LLETTKGNISKAARMSSMHRKSVEYIVRKLDLNIRGGKEDDYLGEDD
jgi:ActR/RegA family two-component response regulator